MSLTSEEFTALAPDLTTGYPRSPRALLGGYVVAARAYDKCRATLAGKNGEYHFDCPLDNLFFGFTGIASADFKAMAATGADDAAMGDWIAEHSQVKEREKIVQWNNDLRYKRINEMPVELQVFLEDYIVENVPAHRPVYYWFDVYDLEEKRL
ncbi:MAG: DUF5069 domain-containing protein [Verrucomicrobiota bacterium]